MIPEFKYLSEKQIKLLRRTVRDKASLDLGRGKVTGIREWTAIDIITSSGLRVSLLGFGQSLEILGIGIGAGCV